MALITPSPHNLMLQHTPASPEASSHLGRGLLPTPEGGKGAPSNVAASSQHMCQEPQPLHCAALEDDLRCGTFRAALPGSWCLPSLPCHTRAAWQQDQPHVGPAGRASSYSRQ